MCIRDRLIGGRYTNTNFVGNNFIARTQLIEIDSGGTAQWEYLSPEGELWNYAYDVLLTDDGGYLIATGRGIEIPSSPFSSSLRWHPYVFKLDSERNFEWGVSLRDSFPDSNELSKLIEVNDGSGYISVGTIYEPNHIENGFDLHGTISKISKEGDSLWTRYHRIVESPIENHIFYDVEETPDGGFIMVGQATDMLTAAEPPNQRAWLVKVDQHGCLVPGCHLISSTEEQISEAPFQLKRYPNPVTDYLNVYFHHPKLKEKAYFDLVDASGKSVLQFASEHGDITHMVSVGDLASGIYWLRCRVGEDVVTSRVIKQ